MAETVAIARGTAAAWHRIIRRARAKARAISKRNKAKKSKKKT